MGELDFGKSADDTEATHLGKVDGLRVLWRHIEPATAANRPNDRAATLRFRVGQADERLAQRGFSRLLERLVVDSFSSEPFTVGGTTGAVITSFSTVGDNPTIARFVDRTAEVIQAIATGAYPPDQIRDHARHARLENSQRHIGVIGGLFTDLYGATRFGAMNFGEFGLDQIDITQFQMWVETRFTRANATLALHTAPPSNLSASAMLPGHQMPSVDVMPLFDGWPACRRVPGPVGFVAPIETRQGVGPLIAILDHAIGARLTAVNINAKVRAAFQPVSADAGLCLGIINADQGSETQVLGVVLDELSRLANGGPTTEEIRLVSDSWFFHNKQGTEMSSALLASGAEDVLFGAALRTDANIHTEMRWLSPERLATHAARIQNSLAMRASADFDWHDRRIRLVHDRSDPPLLRGQPVAPAKDRFDPSPIGYLTMDTRAVSILNPAGRCVTIHAGQAEIMLEWADRTATLVSKSGDTITILPNRWADENLLKGRIRSWLAPHQIKQLGLRSAPLVADPIPSSIGSTWWAKAAAGWFAVGGVGSVLAAVAAAPPMAQSRFVVLLVLIHAVVGLAVGAKLWARKKQLLNPVVYQKATDMVVGPLLLGWLADQGLLAPWVEDGAKEPLRSYRLGHLSPEELFKALGAMVASDMCLPVVVPLLNYCHVPRNPDGQGRIHHIVSNMMKHLGRSNQRVDPVAQGEFEYRLGQVINRRRRWLHPWAPKLIDHIEQHQRREAW